MPEPGELRPEVLQEYANAWRPRLSAAIEELAAKSDATREEFLDIVWEKGILDRAAPTAPEEKQARQELRKDVWDGTRDDEALYWRILYSAGIYKEPEVQKWARTFALLIN